MKINPTGSTGYVTPKARVNGNRAYMQAGNTDRADGLSLSQDALSFSKVLSEARRITSPAADAAGNSACIEELRGRIADGAYRVDSDTLADSILRGIYA